MNPIAVLDDNTELLDDVVYALRADGHAVQGFASAAALRAYLAVQTPSILILDLGLPDADGLDIARQMRQQFPALGLIMMTARTQLADRVAGLREGADVYLCKPVDLDELGAVVESLARRLRGGASTAWQLDIGAVSVTPPGVAPVALTGGELQLLVALCDAPGHKASRRELAKALGEDPYTFDERRLENLVSRLRTKLAASHPVPCLRALRGNGYAFTEPLIRI